MAMSLLFEVLETLYGIHKMLRYALKDADGEETHCKIGVTADKPQSNYLDPTIVHSVNGIKGTGATLCHEQLLPFNAIYRDVWLSQYHIAFFLDIGTLRAASINTPLVHSVL